MAGKIWTVAAVMAVTAVLGVEVVGGLEVVLGAGRAVTQSPTLMAVAETVAWPVNRVEADHDTAVCDELPCTWAVLPETAATTPEAPGIPRPVPLPDADP